ncbi:potassium channel family protein [Stratiformator vulcanicus]|uniref:Voltage-gated potassium channel Kch n=1 Tax=Stratiformator vulcanicus TaxID=2527980 RepID=A0A517R5T4_9PLAN|nr:potassium channel protein [Stratiformator vulcanicus]QDT39220.1 Voltage-gated potassium channel Kch [Stratiformator vulcanicus]
MDGRLSSSSSKILLGTLLFALFCAIAVYVYVTAGWSVLDALYMVAITISTVGYGEPVDTSAQPYVRAFTTLFALVSTIATVYVIGGLVQMVAEGEFNRAMGARRMTTGIGKLSGHAIICGYGRVGQILARDLRQFGIPFVIVDLNAERLHDAEAGGDLVVIGNASEEETLQAAGIERARYLATVLPDDAANVFITLTARDLKSDIFVIARAEDPSTEKKLKRSGADRIVLPAQIGATRIASLIAHPSAESILSDDQSVDEFNNMLGTIGLSMAEIPIPLESEFAGRPLAEVEIAGGIGFLIVALHRKSDGAIIRQPEGKTILEAGDSLMVLGYNAALPKLSRRAQSDHRIRYRGAAMDNN